VLRFWAVTLGCVLLMVVGIGLEIALGSSEHNNGVSLPSRIPRSCADPIYYSLGFFVPEKNVFSFASAQFLTVSVQTFAIKSNPADRLSVKSHFSHLSFLSPLPSWSMVLTGPSDCGMYAFPNESVSLPGLTITIAIPHLVSRTCQGR
jgi:hypothetical protein